RHLMITLPRRDTRPELRLRRGLREAALVGYRTHLPVRGRPDVAFTRWKVAVFVDGAFWHGHPSAFRPGSRRNPYWDTKIESNRSRDRRITGELTKLGWIVIRAWDFEIDESLGSVLDAVRQALGARG